MTDNDPKPFVKHDAGKPRFSLIPPEALQELTAVLAHGAAKYGPDNWRQGAEWSRYYDAAMRHLIAWWSGSDADAESKRSHLGHALACIAFLIAYERRHIGQDDRPKPMSPLDAARKAIEAFNPARSAMDKPDPGSAAAWDQPAKAAGPLPSDWPEIPAHLKREATGKTGREILKESLMGEAAHD